MKHLAMTPELYRYLLDVSLKETDTQRALREETAKLPLANMQVSPEQAQFLQMLLRIIGAKKVLELGTFTGYSALSMALALPADGELITCDINPEWTAIAEPFWKQSEACDKISLRLGPGLKTLQALMDEGHAGTFDFIFIDADKTNYSNYYEFALQLLSPIGLIAIDNVFWEGAVIDEADHSPQTREIRRINERLRTDTRVHTSLLPIADGLFLVKPKI